MPIIPFRMESFELVAMAVHIGNDNKGHYVIYRRGDGPCWYLCNDDKIEKVILCSTL